ncbi:MAG TPA: hypothetical protein VL576_00260 [Candidatus Paceibacterota bacterium]|jgi:hypothetical protein|nr:hypothetical protein [Candidatus Paceibacterota bacterium]
MKTTNLVTDQGNVKFFFSMLQNFTVIDWISATNILLMISFFFTVNIGTPTVMIFTIYAGFVAMTLPLLVSVIQRKKIENFQIASFALGFIVWVPFFIGLL